MSEVKNGTANEPGLATAPAETNEKVPDGAKEQIQSPSPEQPEFGFDATGTYFTVKIDVRFGYRYILGFLEEAKDFVKLVTSEQKRRAAQESGLIKPAQVKQQGNRWTRLFK